MTNTKKVEIGNIYNIGIGQGESVECKVVRIEEDLTNGDQAVLEMIEYGGPKQRRPVASLEVKEVVESDTNSQEQARKAFAEDCKNEETGKVMTKQEKIEKLIEIGYVIGKLDDDSDLFSYLQNAGYELTEDMVVEYEFSEMCVSYIVASDEDEIQSTSTCTEDEWKNFSDDDLDNFILMAFNKQAREKTQETPEQFRLDTAYGKLYEYDKDSKAYICCLSTDANYLEDAIEEHYEGGTIEELHGFGN